MTVMITVIITLFLTSTYLYGCEPTSPEAANVRASIATVRASNPLVSNPPTNLPAPPLQSSADNANVNEGGNDGNNEEDERISNDAITDTDEQSAIEISPTETLPADPQSTLERVPIDGQPSIESTPAQSDAEPEPTETTTTEQDGQQIGDQSKVSPESETAREPTRIEEQLSVDLPDTDDSNLQELMPELFVTETITEEFATDIEPSAEPVSIQSLWQPAQPVPLIDSWSKTENYLILGTDRRPNWSIWRTDVIIVVGLDRPNRRVGLFSIPRDLYIPIPGRGWGRINTVDYIGEERLNVEGGGGELVSAVIHSTLGVPIEHWIRVDMEGFEQLVDAIGGITIHLECPFYEPILNLNTGQWTYFALPPGDVTLTGEEAHWYARLRLRTSDFGRARRQRQLLWALREKMLNANLILRFPELWSALNDKFETDLGLLNLVQLAQFGLPLSSSRVRAGALTSKELPPYTTPGGGAVLHIANLQTVQEAIDNVWNATPISEVSHNDGTQCKPPPPGAPVFPTPTPVP